MIRPRISSGGSFYHLQSTSPVRNMSASKSIAAAVSQFQSTRSVWGVTNRYPIGPGRFWISIHTPRVGRDLDVMTAGTPYSGFQSTRPVWGVTLIVDLAVIAQHISIHTPRVGRD